MAPRISRERQAVHSMDKRIAFLPPQKQRFNWAGYLLGFALGGFFDGILLHQILQWHHLLSGISQAPFDNLRIQIIADGVFHAFMYVIAAIGVRKLLQARFVLIDRSYDRLLAADVLIGFGAWHMADGILSHWLLGIHHVRMDVEDPFLWDLLWFLLFGVLVLAAGIVLRIRRDPPSVDDQERRRRSRPTPASLLIALVTGAALLSALPPSGSGTTATVVLRPDASPASLLSGLQQIDARLVWTSGEVWVFALGEHASPLDFYAHGALLVSGTLLPAGCSAWLRV